jgi:hypothetical protein
MQGAEERRPRRLSNTLQGGTIDGNAADDALMVDQGVDRIKWSRNRLVLMRLILFSCHFR